MAFVNLDTYQRKHLKTPQTPKANNDDELTRPTVFLGQAAEANDDKDQYIVTCVGILFLGLTLTLTF
jgi:hypothetical protein